MKNITPYRLKLPAIVSVDPLPIEDPRREIWIGGGLIGILLMGFVGWSALARLDSAVHSPGIVKVAGDRQTIQSLPGGVISAIHVHEGDHVLAGQIVVELASTEALAEERSLATRAFGLQAEIARITTERAGGSTITPPAEWANLNLTDRAASSAAIASEQTNLNAQRALLDSERSVLRQRIAEVGDQIRGYRERQGSNARQGALNNDELESVQKLYRQGYATKSRVLALQRSAAAIDGDIGATTAEMARLRSSAGETRLQMMQLVSQREQENAERLRTAETELQTLLPQWKAAREQLGLTRIRAPVSGAVIGLVANTVGGVATPGQKLMDIVPSVGDLVVETQVGLSDANDLHAGQRAEIRIAALRGRDLPLLHGTVTRVSADSFVDEHSGRSFYTATVSVPRGELDQIGRDAGISGSVRPGTPVDVIIPLRARSALQYWVSPLMARFSSALSEQ